MSLDSITSLFKNFDPTKYVPQLDTVLGWLELGARLAVMAGPLIMLGLGLFYFLSPPKEANHKAGYRTYFGMGSVEAWRFTQRLAGLIFAVAGFLLTVVMTLICNGFRGMDAMHMTGVAAKCILWQLGLAAVGVFAVEVTAVVRYDRTGIRRSRKEK